MEIRRLRTDEADILESAVHRLFALAELPEGPGWRRHLGGALADPNCYFLVCIVESAPVGFLSAYRFPAVDQDGFFAYLYDIVVDPGHRRQGIGARLIAYLKHCCRADDVARIWVGTSLDNHAARRSFEATGARRVSETYIEYIYELDGPTD